MKANNTSELREKSVDELHTREKELHEQLFNSYERPQPTPAQKIMRAVRSPVDPAWVEYVFDKVSLLVAEGDAAGLAAAVAELAHARTAMVEASSETPGGAAA